MAVVEPRSAPSKQTPTHQPPLTLRWGKLHLERRGEKGRPLVFIHGAGGSHLTWRYQIEHFSPNHKVVALDLPGHHFSNRTGVSKDIILEVLEAVIGELPTPPILVGHSMGGAITLTYALTNPQDVEGLVLVGTGARLKVHPHLLRLLEDNPDEAVEMISGMATSPGADPQIKGWLVSEMKRTDPEVLLEEFRFCDAFDVMGSLTAINHPTLVVCGEEDKLTPPKYSDYLHKNIPHSQFKVIRGAGHMIMLEKPSEFNRALEEFFSTLG